MIDRPAPFELPPPAGEGVHETLMRMALIEAQQAAEEGEVPVGAVIVRGGRVIASAHNQREQLKDPTAHAEIIAITQAATSVGGWRLDECTLYVTLEPCVMCAGAIVQARIPIVVYGATDPKAGAVDSLFHLLADERLNHRCHVIPGVLALPCGAILSEFFQDQRRQGKK
jgi:tRNA(adenine34) deaminase